MKKYFKMLALCLALVLCLALTACDDEYDYENGAATGESTSAPLVQDTSDRKIVYHVTVHMETKDVSALKTTVSEKNTALGGYVEESSEDYEDGKCSYARLTFRVPTEKLDELMSTVEDSGSVVSKSVDTTDITTKYANAEARKSALENRKQLLTSMLEDTSLTASERMSVIDEISSVGAELEALALMLNEYDSDIGFSTVKMTLTEPTTFWDVFIPLFLLLGAPVALVVIILVLVSRRDKKIMEKQQKA